MLDHITEPEMQEAPEANYLLDEPEEEEGTPVPESMHHIPRQCYHNITAGHRCHALALRGEYFCRHHLRRPRAATPPPMEFELPAVPDRDALRDAVLDIARRVAANTLDCRRAGMLLYSLQIVGTTFPPLARQRPKAEETLEPEPARPRTPEEITASANAYLLHLQALRTGSPDPFDAPTPENPGAPPSRAARARVGGEPGSTTENPDKPSILPAMHASNAASMPDNRSEDASASLHRMPLLFIYGTLHPDRAPREIAAVARRLKPLGAATIRGRLLDLGEYPGLILEDAEAAARHTQPKDGASFQDIPGELFEVPDQATLAALDRYEDFRADDPATSLFLRVEAQVRLHDGSTLMCWVYIYNR